MKVGIVGVGLIPFKVRHPDKTYYELAVEAFCNALDDAKITREKVDNVVYGMGDLYVPAIRQACAQLVLQDIEIQGFDCAPRDAVALAQRVNTTESVWYGIASLRPGSSPTFTDRFVTWSLAVMAAVSAREMNPMLTSMSRLMTGSLVGRGGRFMMSGSPFSNPRARAGAPSVTRFSKRS